MAHGSAPFKAGVPTLTVTNVVNATEYERARLEGQVKILRHALESIASGGPLIGGVQCSAIAQKALAGTKG